MARISKNTTKKLNIHLKDNKYNENISYVDKAELKFEHDVNTKVKYIGGAYMKGATCTITKQVLSKGKLYYSVIFDNTDAEVNWIMEHLLQKIEVQNVETINPDTPIEGEANET